MFFFVNEETWTIKDNHFLIFLVLGMFNQCKRKNKGNSAEFLSANPKFTRKLLRLSLLLPLIASRMKGMDDFWTISFDILNLITQFYIMKFIVPLHVAWIYCVDYGAKLLNSNISILRRADISSSTVSNKLTCPSSGSFCL